ncbi:MAG: tetratricopeptide repeat protein [Rhodospirillales bacterium]
MTSFRHSSIFFLASLLFSVPLAAAEINNAREYARCMAIAPSDPNDAFELATAWKGLGGGDAAEHCASVALLYAGQTEFAARRLEVLAENIVAEPEFKGQILAQAGQAWLLFGDAARAEAALSEAVKLLRGRPEVLIDRAQARAAMSDYKGAVEDLTNAISADPKRVDAYTFRGSAYRYLEEPGKARADINAALELSPNDPAALLERGILFRLSGNNTSARADWLKVLELDPEGEAGRLAQKNIEKMDVKVD